jgi:tetratricopeptide (TPR) repeat protein
MHRIKQRQKVNSIDDDSHQSPNPARHSLIAKRYTVCALILSLSAVAAYPLSLRLISQIHYLQAKNFMQQGSYGLAAHALQKAAAYLPEDYKIQKQLGHAVYRLGEKNPTAQGAYNLAEKAGAHYQKAFRLNPFDAQSAFGIAWQEDRLEQLYLKLNPGEKINPHNALPYYYEAIRLRPNGVRYHYALARYLHRKGKQDELNRVVRKLARIFPPTYDQLKKEDFWSDNIKAATRQGLEEAIQEDILPAAAHMSLVDIAVEEKDWSSAIAHFNQALQITPQNKTDSTYYRLGRLYLKNGAVQAARSSFIKSLSLSRSREKHLASIYRLFKKEGALNEFEGFYHDVQQRFALSAQSGILLVQCFINLKQYDLALQTIEELIAEEPTAEAYYWLAQVAGKEKNWDEMERAIQKATVLDPENHKYRRIFFKILKRQKKFENAELQLDLMIDRSEVASASLFDEKAWLRWKQKDYTGALKAWQSAIRLKSDNAAYYAQAAEAYLKLGNWSGAVSYYKIVTKLNPQNDRYTKRYREIMGSDSEG